MLQRPQELQPWQNAQNHPHQPHDVEHTEHVRKHFFSPACSYSVETVVSPCGVVIAWTKLEKSESPTKILNYLATIYSTPEFDLLISALIKPAWFSEQPLPMDLGMDGKRQLVSLSTRMRPLGKICKTCTADQKQKNDGNSPNSANSYKGW